MARNNLSPIMSLFTPRVIANRLQIIIEALSVFLSDFMDFVNYGFSRHNQTSSNSCGVQIICGSYPNWE